LRPVALAVALAVHAPDALALGNDTVFLRGSALVGYDSNVFRISEDLELPPALGGPQKSGTFYGLGAGIRFDLPVSRQRLRFDASATNYFYQHFENLDYTGYAARGTWDWRVGNRWYGQLGAGTRQTRQVATDALGFTFPRLQTGYDALANARYALTPRWELQAGASYYTSTYADERFAQDEFESSAFDIGASYRTPRGNSTGARLRYERGRWPNRSAATAALFGGEYDQYTLSAVFDWQLTGRSKLHGDIGYTVRQRDEAQQGDFDGPSGRLTYLYSLTGRTTLRGSIYETRGPTDTDMGTYVRTRGLAFSTIYQATGKIGLQGDLGYSQATYLGDALTPSAERREYEYWFIGLAGLYQATRTLTFNANLRYDWRTANVPFGDYEAATASIGAGLEF
jgi:exopolysaccharide biosynthesis operon protein EpsL